MAVFKDTNGTYYVRLWYKTWKGERKQKTKRGFEKQKDAKKWEREFLAVEQHEMFNIGTLIELFEKNIDNQLALGKIRQSTAERKKDNINLYIKDYFGNAEINNITIDVINKWISYITENPKKAERLSSSTVKLARNLLSQIFKFGIKQYGLKFNPVESSDCPARFSNNKRVRNWEIDDYRRFYNSLTKEQHKVIFNILFWAGLRLGECLALTPADVTLTSITVNKTWIRLRGSKKAGVPKSLNSFREIPIPNFLATQINEYIASIDGIKDTDRIFSLDRSYVNYVMKRQVERLKLPYASPHTLRHSFVSYIVDTTGNLTVAAALAGDTLTTVSKTYAHPIKESIENAIKNLEKLHEKTI